MSFDTWALERRRRVEEALRRALDRSAAPPRLGEAMAYSLLGGGKRLRPLLAIGAAEAVGGSADDALPVATAVELVHTYSLIHDDLPCMDDDDLRRGRPTSHMVFGDARAILAGDALQAVAFEVLAAEISLPARAAAIVAEIARAAGPGGMAGGQEMDLASAGKTLSIAELERMHRLKTGALFVASVRGGALAAGSRPEELAALSAYAEAFGLAFQIADDVLDVVGDEALLGKPVGTDAAHAKSTFPAVLGIAASRARAEELVREAHAALASFGEKADPLRHMARLAVERDR
jgi:geranylgeranyl diphosphate synthase type II